MCSWYCCVSSHICYTNITFFYFHRILFSRFLLTRKSNTDGQNDIELNDNTAYDTVKNEQSIFQQGPEPESPYENENWY